MIMACFLVPAVEAIVVTVATQAVKSKEKKSAGENGSSGAFGADIDTKNSFSKKLKWLSGLLWGGSFLLAFEHVWHGEVVPWFPFLTAAGNPTDAAEMLHEMSTAGVTMAALVTAVWVAMVLVTGAMAKKAIKAQTAVN
jgi:hypothetical protein